MADFAKYVEEGTRRHRRIKAGFQKLYNDKGNWTGGEIGVGNLAGTNMSISAPVLSAWRGYAVTEAQMRALTEAEALQIYKAKYWDAILGDQIESQTIANFVADMKSSAGGNGVKEFQKALNTLGANIAVDGAFGQETLAATNTQIGKSIAKLNNQYHDNMVNYYERVGVGTNAQFKNGWISSLKKDYPKMSVTAEKVGLSESWNNRIIIGSVVLAMVIVVTTLIIIKYR